MSLTKEERHALATRIRLGETIPNCLGLSAPWRTGAGDGYIDVLGVRIATSWRRLQGMDYVGNYSHPCEWQWENGQKFIRSSLNSDALTAAVLDYLERDT